MKKTVSTCIVLLSFLFIGLCYGSEEEKKWSFEIAPGFFVPKANPVNDPDGKISNVELGSSFVLEFSFNRKIGNWIVLGMEGGFASGVEAKQTYQFSKTSTMLDYIYQDFSQTHTVLDIGPVVRIGKYIGNTGFKPYLTIGAHLNYSQQVQTSVTYTGTWRTTTGTTSGTMTESGIYPFNFASTCFVSGLGFELRVNSSFGLGFDMRYLSGTQGYSLLIPSVRVIFPI